MKQVTGEEITEHFHKNIPPDDIYHFASETFQMAIVLLRSYAKAAPEILAKEMEDDSCLKNISMNLTMASFAIMMGLDVPIYKKESAPE